MGKKIGYFFYSLTPAIACIFLQLFIAVVVMTIAMVGRIAGMSEMDPLAIEQIANETALSTASLSVFIYHIVGIIVFGIWYYFGCGRPKMASPKTVLNFKFWGSAILGALIFITMNYLIVFMIDWIAPEIIEAYIESLEMLQISNGTLLIITTVFLAPIGEEILMRGLTLHIAQKCTKHFWVANTIQALLFGFIHLNFVQGTYAFIGGLLLGWLYKKYHSLYIVILVHFLVNLSASTWADPVFSMVPENAVYWILIGIAVLVSFIMLFIWNGGAKENENYGQE